MNTAKIYYDINGDERNIHQMINLEPNWAANRIQEGEKAKVKVEQLIAELVAADGIYRLLKSAILKLSKSWDEHPEDYGGPCNCATCMSYADGTPPWSDDND